MKKLLSFALILMVCFTSALLFAGCDSNKYVIQMDQTEAASYKFVVYPEKDFDQELYEKYRLDMMKTLSITVYENNDGQLTADATRSKIKLNEVEERGGRVSGFTLKYLGTRTATVTYEGCSVSFQFEVVEKLTTG